MSFTRGTELIKTAHFLRFQGELSTEFPEISFALVR